MAARSRLTMQFKDFDGNTIQSSFDGDACLDDGSNYVAQKTLSNALRTAILAIVTGNTDIEAFASDYENFAVGDASSSLSQTNIQWQAQYSDNVNGLNYTKRMGTADLSLAVKTNGITVLPLSGTEGAALKTAFEAFVVSPDGNPITLDGVVYVQ